MKSKSQLLLLLLSIGLLCSSEYNTAFAGEGRSESVRIPMETQYENSMYYTAESKQVYESLLIDDMEDPSGWSVEGIAKISYTADRAKDGVQSLRFRTNKRDEDYLKNDTETNGSFTANQGGHTHAVLSFEEPQDWTKFNRISLWVYVHPTGMRTYCFSLRFKCMDAPYGLTTPHAINFVQDLEHGRWNRILWEIPNLPRDKVTEFRITQTLSGHDPEVEGIVTFDFDKLELQRVDAEKYEGWEPAPGKLSFNHVGYKPEQTKTAVGSGLSASDFQLVDALTGEAVFTGPVTTMTNNLGDFQVLDFTAVRTPGRFRIKADGIETRPFIISDTLWRQPVYKAMNFFYCERCGFDVPGIHRECHRDWQGTYNGVTKVINGGWHDAGDLSQGSFRTGMVIYSMIDMLRQLELRDSDPEMQSLLLEEAVWGLDWLLKTRFDNGYRMTWSKMRMYTDCEIGTHDDVISPAQNIPWENFLAAGVEAFAYEILKNRKPQFADRCLQAAKEDWEAGVERESEWIVDDGRTMGWNIKATYLTLSWAAASSAYLFEATGEQKYEDQAAHYGRLLMSCQERRFIDGIPFTGYFYTCPEKYSILHHVHAAFEEAPLLALMKLCNTFSEHKDWIEWYGAAALHSDYFIKRGAEYSAPYYMIPNSVNRRSEMMNVRDPEERDGVLKRLEEGTRLTDEFYLRFFPVHWYSPTLHGNTGVQLSETMALTSAVRLRNDLDGENLSHMQLQWVFGGNPFSQSLMYGEGYDFAPQFAYCLEDVVGSLPVGIDCLQDDKPYWAGSNYATFKEIWVVPVSRFMGCVSTLGLPAFVHGKLMRSGTNTVTFQNRMTWKRHTVNTDLDGSFQSQLPAGEYLVEYGTDVPPGVLTVVSGGNYNLNLNPSWAINFTTRVKKQNNKEKSITIEVMAEGNGIHQLELRLFNGRARERRKSLNLEALGQITFEWDVRIEDPEIPWVAVIIPDGDHTWKKELTGTME